MVKITVSTDAIVAESTDHALTMNDLLDALNLADGSVADAILEVMPEDYDYIINDEQYGTLFAFGSPQIFECNWKFNFEISLTGHKLTVTGFR